MVSWLLHGTAAFHLVGDNGFLPLSLPFSLSLFFPFYLPPFPSLSLSLMCVCVHYCLLIELTTELFQCICVCDECDTGFTISYGMGQTSVTPPTGFLRSGNSSSCVTFPVKHTLMSKMSALTTTLSLPSSSCYFMSLLMWRPWLAATYIYIVTTHHIRAHSLFLNSYNVCDHTLY